MNTVKIVFYVSLSKVIDIALTEYFQENYNIDTITVIDVLFLVLAKVVEDKYKNKPNLFSSISESLRKIYDHLRNLMETPIDGIKIQPKVSGPVGIKGELLLELIFKSKENQSARNRLRQYIEREKRSIQNTLNDELKKIQEKNSLVILIDDLDRRKDNIDGFFRHDIKILKQIQCHIVCTVPLEIQYFSELKQRFLQGGYLPIIPMISIRDKNGLLNDQGLQVIKQIIFARAFPDTDLEERKSRQTEIFKNQETLDRLCQLSGGHLRQLMAILYQYLNSSPNCLPIDCSPIDGNLNFDRIVNQYTYNCFNSNVTEENLAKIQRLEISARPEVNDCADLFYQLLVFEYLDSEGKPYYLRNPLINIILADRGRE